MKNYIQIFSLFMLFIFYNSCIGQHQTDQSKESTTREEHGTINIISTITDYRTIINPNAPTRITRNIKHDSEGNLLFAAYESIIRYDGESFTNLTKEKGLENCYAFDVLEDRKGNIWIASDREGVYRIDATTGNIKNFTTNDGLGNRRNMCIYEDRAGNIWIGGMGGVSIYDPVANLKPGEKSFQNYTSKEGLTDNNVNCIMEDRAGNIWIGTRGTACVFDGKTFTEIKNEEGESFINAWSFQEDRKGDIWISGNNVTWHYDPSADLAGGISYTKIPIESGYSYEDKKGNIWTIGSSGNPRDYIVSRHQAESLLGENPNSIPAFIKASIEGSANGMIFCVSEDKVGDIWIGTLFGVCRYNGKTLTCFNDSQEKD